MLEDITLGNILVAILWTWVLGLLPAYLIRFKFYKKPLKKRFAIPITFIVWLTHMVTSLAIQYASGLEPKPSGALNIVALVSYMILIKKNNEKTENQ